MLLIPKALLLQISNPLAQALKFPQSVLSWLYLSDLYFTKYPGIQAVVYTAAARHLLGVGSCSTFDVGAW